MGLPVVSAATETFDQLSGGQATGWTFAPRAADSMREAIEQAARRSRTERASMGAAAFRQAQRLQWPAIAERTAALLRAIR